MTKHVRTISKMPARAADIPVTAKVDFITAILQAFTPILEAKEPSQQA